MNINVRRVYLYLSSLIGMVLILIGSVQLLNLALKAWVFTKADDQYYYGACERPAAVEEGKPVSVFDEGACLKQQTEQRSARRQDQAANAVALILVGSPVWLYHWNKVKNENDKDIVV